MISGLVLKYLNGECFVIFGCYKYTLLASTKFNLTVPGVEMDNIYSDRWSLDDADRAYKEFDKQTGGKQVFVF